MNRNYGNLVALLIFVSSGLSLAAQAVNISEYRRIRAAYERNDWTAINPAAAIDIVEAHKKELESRKKAIEGSYFPALLRIVAGSLVIGSSVAFGLAMGGAIGSYKLLSLPENVAWKGTRIETRGLGYPEWLKSKYGYDESMPTRGRLAITERFIEEQAPKEAKTILRLGYAAPPLIAVSLVLAPIYQYFSNKAASYTDIANTLQQEINLDNNILNVLRALPVRVA